jgi:hypothetical protein
MVMTINFKNILFSVNRKETYCLYTTRVVVYTQKFKDYCPSEQGWKDLSSRHNQPLGPSKEKSCLHTKQAGLPRKGKVEEILYSNKESIDSA